MGPSKEGTRILHFVRPSTNLSKDMRALNRPNFNTESRLAQNGGGPAGGAARIAGHASPKTTKLYDRTADTVTVDEIERIVI